MSTRARKDTQRVQRRDANAAQRASMAMQLRAQRYTYDEIAQKCGYSDRGACYKAVQRELQRNVSASVEEMRREELAMLDQMHQEIWDLFMDKENKARLFAADRLFQISERRAKLMGMDQTTGAAIAASQVIIREIPQGYLSEVKA